MKKITAPTVHRVSIARSEGAARPTVYTAKCHLCGVILERNEGPLSINVHGLYATIGEGTEGARAWKVDEPLSDGLVLCSANSSAVSA
jgi:hypothetical protein